MGVWVRDPKDHCGKGLAFLEFSTRGLRRGNPKSFLWAEPSLSGMVKSFQCPVSSPQRLSASVFSCL